MNFPAISVIVFGVELPLGELIATALLEQHRAVWAIVRGDEGLTQDLFNIWLEGLHCDGRLEVSQWEPGELNPTAKTLASWESGWPVDSLGRRVGFDALVMVRSFLVAGINREEERVCDWTRSRLDKSALILPFSDAGYENPTELKWVLLCLGLNPSPSRPG